MKILKKMLAAASGNKGSLLIEACASIVVLFVVLAFGITVLPCFIEGQKLQHFATGLVRTAEISGTTEVQQRVEQLINDTGITPHSISWKDTNYIINSKRVQLNGKIVVKLTYSYELKLFGFDTKNIPMSATASGSSEVYFK